MAATELVSDASSETQLTASPLTNDQLAASSVASDAHDPTQDDSACLEVQKQEQPPTPAQDIQSHQEIQKDCEVILDANSTPQACQQIEIVSEEPSSLESPLPQIDAVWSIGQEHSYEQRPDKCKERADASDEAEEASQLAEQKQPYSNNSFECDKENHTCTTEKQHTPSLLHSENLVQESVQTSKVQVPQILKIQTKASKKYFIQDGADPSGKRPKLHDTKTPMTVRKTYKTTQVLKLQSSHGISQSKLNSCLIDHNLKPLQIQHNLENKKSQSNTVLQLDTLGLKFQDDITGAIQYPIRSDPSPCLLKKTSCRGNGDQFIIKEVPTGYPKADEEVDTEAVYLDIDANPSIEPNFNGSSQIVETEDAGTDENISSMLDNCNLQSLSMDQYLPDFSDLPQFPNIPLDAEDDTCTEPLHLTPSIPHSVLNYDWQQCYTSCYSYTSHASPSITNQPQVAMETIPNPTSLSQFINGNLQKGGRGHVNSPSTASTAGMDAVVSAGVGGVITAQFTSSGESTHALTQLNTATMMTSASSTATIKTEDQVS